MITIGLLREWGACWLDDSDGAERLSAIAGGRAGLSPREVAGLEQVSLDDRLWVVCRALSYRDEGAARTYTLDRAAEVSHLAGTEQDQAEHARLVAEARRIYALPAEAREAELVRWSAASLAASLAAGWDAMDDDRSAAWDVASWASRADVAVDVVATATSWASDRDAALQRALDLALIALGPDADGWTA